MLLALNLFLLCGTAAICFPIWMFCLEILLSFLPKRRKIAAITGELSPLTVLIPAHNEAFVLGHTLQTLMPTLPPATRVVVVTDNCTDSTADIARRHGAEAIERTSHNERGKGYALKFGLAHIAQSPPAAVVFLDADCQVAPDAVRLLGHAALSTGRPIQGLYLCDSDAVSGPIQAVSGLAFRFKNLIRMTGLARLADICYLTGAGMALPWPLINKARLDGNVVEDMQWGIDLALADHPPLFLPEAYVNSPLPQTQKAASTQRTRWEHGHLSTLLSQVPRLLLLALKYRRWNLLCLSCDLVIPPLSLLAAVYLVMLITTITFAVMTSHSIPASMLLAVSPLFILAIAAGWFVHCRRVIPLGTLLVAPLYVLRKLPIYGRFLGTRQLTWVRTERDLAPRV